MNIGDLANNCVAWVDWHNPHAKRQVMENIQRMVDAYVQEKVDQKLGEATFEEWSKARARRALKGSK